MIHNSQPLNERIRELRKKAGYSQQQMAQKLHLTQGAISQWENGITVPAADQLSCCVNRAESCFLCRLWYAKRYAGNQ